MAWTCAEQLTTWRTPLRASMVSIRLLACEIHIALAPINSNREQVTHVTQIVPMNRQSLDLLPASENGFTVWQKRCWLQCRIRTLHQVALALPGDRGRGRGSQGWYTHDRTHNGARDAKHDVEHKKNQTKLGGIKSQAHTAD